MSILPWVIRLETAAPIDLGPAASSRRTSLCLANKDLLGGVHSKPADEAAAGE